MATSLTTPAPDLNRLTAIGPNGEFADVVSLMIRADISSDTQPNKVLYDLIRTP
jgi:hypothetical protein